MYQHKSFHEFHISQLQLISDFCTIKAEILSLLVSKHNPSKADSITVCIESFEQLLEQLEKQYIPIPRERPAAKKMRLNGTYAIHRNIENVVADLLGELDDLYEWTSKQHLEPWEYVTLDETMKGFVDILARNIHLILQPNPDAMH